MVFGHRQKEIDRWNNLGKTKMTTNETMPELKQACETFFDSWFGPAFGPPEHLERIAARHEKSKQEFSEKLYQFVQLWQKDDTVSAAVREVEQAIANQTKTMRGIAALIKGRGYDMISAEDQEEAWMREALRLERATDKALAALRGLGE